MTLVSGPTSHASALTLGKGERQMMCKIYFLMTLILFCPSEDL